MNAIAFIIAIMFGGALGALARHSLSLVLIRTITAPSAILCINLIGCFVIGLLSAYFLRVQHMWWRFFLITGFLGSFTTYSTFTVDLLAFLESGSYYLFARSILLHLVLGIALCFAGLSLGRFLFLS